MAVECPSLVGRKRCTLCLCTTDVEAVEEDDLDPKDRMRHEYEELIAGAMEAQDDGQDKEVLDPNVGLELLARYLYSCPELENARLLRKIRRKG